MSRHSTAWDPQADPAAPARGFNPPRTRRLWRDTLLPRAVFPVYAVAWLGLVPARSWRRPPLDRRIRIAVESGRIGWTHVFYEELWQSLVEYAESAELTRVVVDRDAPYAPQARAWTTAAGLTHAVIDLRTGPQDWRGGLASAFGIAWRLGRRGVAPIVLLTDASLRRHRAQAAIITAHRGVVVTFMDRHRVRRMFPHRRIIGPLPMPVSRRRLDALPPAADQGDGTVVFIGSVYPPRSVFLERLGERLSERGVALRINGDKYGTSNEDYWRTLATSGVLVTTTLQGMPRDSMDWIWIQQLVFRFSEALAAGAVLAAPAVEGADRFFTPGEDFAPFGSLDEAVEVLARLATDPSERARLRVRGGATGRRLVQEQVFWRLIDESLASAGSRRLRV